ncbi:MAG: hypothetical protein H6662_16420 [Ardenticatenaceae bacterium]|nr:hypothetical protein [Anaerolineales bacterium]MCB8923173.1 hypothetical protein [Ardenticatenaceae bacterium]MCB9005178.1 hypothetical protein [Ardenticatenaceae bacterium]
MKYYTQVNNQDFEIDIDHEDEITVNGETYTIDFQTLAEAGLTSLLINNRSLEGAVEERGDVWEVLMLGKLYAVKVQDERSYRLAQARGVTTESGGGDVKAPMPGMIIAVPVSVGDVVQKGDKVIILESMKMENELRAPRDGVVVQVRTEPGASVEKDQLLVVISEEKGEIELEVEE